jgi:hypothetical protein
LPTERLTPPWGKSQVGMALDLAERRRDGKTERQWD